jgi:branched-chain amino acid transport system ATP-binding protein
MIILKTVGLTKDFSGLRALDNLDISVEECTVHGLIGPNGSGKSTFFNVITGSLPATQGRVYFGSEDITTLKPDIRARMGIGRTFQKAKVMDRMSCLENIMAGLYCHTKTGIWGTFFHLPSKTSSQEVQIKQKALELLDFVGLLGSADRWAGELVWVEHQLLQIARALALEPRLLLLDEPTAGMGDTETQQVQKIIERIHQKGVTVVVVSHDVKLVTRITNSVTVINFGKKIAEGNPDEVKNNPAVVEAYLGSEKD